MRVGLVGSTGLVGQTILKVLAERKFPVTSLKPFASEASKGKFLSFLNSEYTIDTLSEDSIKDLDIVFIATGEDISELWTPKLAALGTFVVDNSSAFRLHPEVPLVCPEINGDSVNKDQKIYANPNCSTTQLVVMLGALKKAGTLKDIVVASYQAVSGAGIAALDELKNQSADQNFPPAVFPSQIAFNCIPQIGSFDSLGFSTEEQKIMKETKKILNLSGVSVSAQTVRVPVENAHAESVWVTFENAVSKADILKVFNEQEGLHVKTEGYHTQIEISDKEDVFVSRIRQDIDNPKRWLFWLVSDNMRKGAATNSVQIAEKILKL